MDSFFEDQKPAIIREFDHRVVRFGVRLPYHPIHIWVSTPWLRKHMQINIYHARHIMPQKPLKQQQCNSSTLEISASQRNLSFRNNSEDLGCSTTRVISTQTHRRHTKAARLAMRFALNTLSKYARPSGIAKLLPVEPRLVATQVLHATPSHSTAP